MLPLGVEEALAQGAGACQAIAGGEPGGQQDLLKAHNRFTIEAAPMNFGGEFQSGVDLVRDVFQSERRRHGCT